MDARDQDIDLVRVAQGGDKAAFGALVARHRPLLLAVCRRALSDPELAEDVAQDAIVHALLSLDRLRRPERFGPWLAGIGLNLCHRLRRQRAREAWSWEAMLGGRMLPEPTDEAPSVEEQAEAAELRRWVQAPVAGLPAGQRAAVTLHYLAGLTQTETAAVLGIEPGAVKGRLHKARASLRRALCRDFEPEPPPERRRVMVPMQVVDVGRRRVPEDDTARHFVVLNEVNGSRRLPIWIGSSEATALALLEGVPFARPMTYALMAGLLGAAGGNVREVRIDRLEGDVFYAVVALDGPAGSAELDARPSDALNLALILSAPIQVVEEVLAATGIERTDEVAADGQVEWRAVIAADIEKSWPASRSEPATEPSTTGAG
jgi:RNA polymerase sigma factor (sigma-70 family)